MIGLVIKDPSTGEAITKLNGFISTPESVAPIFCKFEWSQMLSLDMLVVVFTFLFIDMFDTMGTIIGVHQGSGMADQNSKRDDIPGMDKMFMADSVATVCGACLGTSTTTTYVESASGVGEGGRTGLTAFSTAVCFALALFFSPLFLAIPSAATAPALIIVGVMMMPAIKRIHWEDYCRAIPAFLTIIIMPLAYSISDGILIGVISYVVCHIVAGKFKSISIAMWILAILFICKYIFI
jgi:AGZA family xanthine/uracil permease-like MFS transporter